MSDPTPVMVDANALDRDGTERDRLVDRFLALVDRGHVILRAAASVGAELLHPHTPEAVRAAVLPYVVARSPSPTHVQKLDRIRVRAVLRGDAPLGRHEADAAHLSEAAETGCAFFITHDKRILRRRGDLRIVLPPTLRVVTLAGFLDTRLEADEGWA